MSELYGQGARNSETKSYLSRCGYAKGGAVDGGDRKAVHAHEKHLHRGEKETKLARGGHVHGSEPKMRPDKRARGGKVGKPGVAVVVHAGGAEMAKQDGIKQGMQQGMRLGAALGAHQAASQMQKPPMGMPPGGGAGGPPPGMPAAGPMGGMKRGGAVKEKSGQWPEMKMTGGVEGGREAARRGGKIAKRDLGGGIGGLKPMQMVKRGGTVKKMEAGAGSGEGRLEKIGKIKVKAHERRKAGGAV